MFDLHNYRTTLRLSTAIMMSQVFYPYSILFIVFNRLETLKATYTSTSHIMYIISTWAKKENEKKTSISHLEAILVLEHDMLAMLSDLQFVHLSKKPFFACFLLSRTLNFVLLLVTYRVYWQ